MKSKSLEQGQMPAVAKPVHQVSSATESDGEIKLTHNCKQCDNCDKYIPKYAPTCVYCNRVHS